MNALCNAFVQGREAIPFIESLVVGDIGGMENGSGCYSLYTNERGGVIDDTVIMKASLSSACAKK